MNETPHHNICDVSDRDAHTYATTKLAAAAVLSASYLPDMVPAYNLGFVGAAYTAAHEAVELLLKLYLQRGPQRLTAREAWGTISQSYSANGVTMDVAMPSSPTRREYSKKSRSIVYAL